jgi:hypothetical protein
MLMKSIEFIAAAIVAIALGYYGMQAFADTIQLPV